MSALVISVVAWTIGAVMSAGLHAGLGEQRGARRCARRRAAPAGVVSVLSTTTCPLAASSSTTSVNVPPMSTARRQSGDGHADQPFRVRSVARRGEHVEDPALVELVVADEHAVAVPDVIAARGRPRRRRATTRRLVVGVADAEVERAAHDDAELLVVDVVVQERSGRAPPAMRQKHSCRRSPVITRRRKPGRSVSLNLSSS